MTVILIRKNLTFQIAIEIQLTQVYIYIENMHVSNSIMLTIKAELDSDFLVPNFTGNATEISNPLGIGGTRKLRWYQGAIDIQKKRRLTDRLTICIQYYNAVYY